MTGAIAEVDVPLKPDDAFEMFTSEIGLWWRRDTPYWNDRVHGRSVRIEPWLGGRFVEVYDLDTGEGFEVGRVIEWEPGQRLSFTWTQVGWPDDARTVVTVTFTEATEAAETPNGARTRTRVVLTHDGFDTLPQDRQADRTGYAGGWPIILSWYAEQAGQAG